jgi:hypothetical protein
MKKNKNNMLFRNILVSALKNLLIKDQGFSKTRIFLEKIINLRIIKKSADLGKIRQGPPQTQNLRVCLKSATFSTYPQDWIKRDNLHQ